MARVKGRQKRGTGGLQRKNGKYEGRYRIYRQDNSYIEKSFTRPTEAEINDIKAKLRLLGILDNDVINIEINKRTNEITLIRALGDNPKKKFELNKDISVDDYVDYWLWNHRQKGEKKQMIKDSTFEDYVQKCNNIKQIIGKVNLENGKTIQLKIRDLTFDFIENALLEFHKTVAHTTAVQVRNHIYNMMKYATKDGIIETNPFQDEEINFPEPKPKTKKKIIKENDIEKVIQYCLRNWHIEVLTQLMTGARGGEIRGLRWEDIDFNTSEITFNNGYNSVQRYKLDENNHIVSLGRQRRYSSLKTKTSQRSILVEDVLMRVLMLHKECQKRLANRLYIPFKESDPVFTTGTYTPYGRNDINDKVKKIVKELELDNWNEITSHCLRHGYCYAGLLNDVPVEYMQILLGHSSISTTMKWYAQFDKSKINSYAKQVNVNRVKALKSMEVKGKAAV